MIVRIKNLRLKVIIGIDQWERKKKQAIVINIEYEIKNIKAHKTDKIQDTLNYRTLTKKIVKHVTSSRYFLLEKLAHNILKIILENKRITWAKVEVDKLKALRFSDSVSVEVTSSGRF